MRFRVAAKMTYHRLGEGPLQMGIADLVALGTVTLADRLGLALDQAAIGSELLDRIKAIDVADLIQDREREDTANAVNGPEQYQIPRVVVFHLLFNKAFNLADFLVEEAHQMHVHIDVALYRWIIEDIAHQPSARWQA